MHGETFATLNTCLHCQKENTCTAGQRQLFTRTKMQTRQTHNTYCVVFWYSDHYFKLQFCIKRLKTCAFLWNYVQATQLLGIHFSPSAITVETRACGIKSSLLRIQLFLPASWDWESIQAGAAYKEERQSWFWMGLNAQSAIHCTPKEIRQPLQSWHWFLSPSSQTLSSWAETVT